MIRRHRLLASLLVVPALLATACDDETIAPPDASVVTADAAVVTGDAGAADGGAQETGPGADSGSDGAAAIGAPGVVVVHSDYKSTVVSLVDPVTGKLIRDNCINSGSKPAKLTSALSGDVVVPTQRPSGGEVLLIDRQNATLTWVNPRGCEVSRQLNIGEGKMANPQDVVPVSTGKAYVPRYASVTSDLLVIDPAAATITGHIDLRPFAPKAGDKQVLANPSRGVLVGQKVYVVLTALSEDSMTAAPGRVVVIDPATDTVTSTIDLPSLKNCGGIAATEGGLLVSCGGVYGDPKQVADSGVAFIDPASTPPAIKIVSGTAFGRAISPFDVAGLSSSLAFAITGGDFSGSPADQLWAFDFAGGAPRKLVDGLAAFTFSGLLVDPATKKLFLADGNPTAPRLHMFDLTNPSAPAITSIVTNQAGVPPRYVGWY
jgi:hypothetical protein